MSKIPNDGLTRSGTGCFVLLYPYGNSGHQRVKSADLLISWGWRITIFCHPCSSCSL